MGAMQSIRSVRHELANAWQRLTRPQWGRVYAPDPMLDSFRNYVTDSLTFPKLRTLVRAKDIGDFATTLSLFEEMEGKDLHLGGVAHTRRCALTGLEWEIVSAADVFDGVVDRVLADEAADFARETLTNLEMFDEVLEHLAMAIGTNLAVAELVWATKVAGAQLVDLVPIPSWRLRSEADEINQVRIETRRDSKGVLAMPGKFIIHSPQSKAGFRMRCTLCESQASVYLIKLLAVADWSKYSEIFGMPTRWGTYKSGATKEEKDEAISMLQTMSAASYGLFSEAIQLGLIESSQRGTSPHRDLIDWCERKQSIGWLGQHMTTDTSGATGTMATAKVQDDVRMDLREDDIRREGRTIRRQLLAAIVEAQFPGRDAPVPFFDRKRIEPKDRKSEADGIGAAQTTGVEVPRQWAYERLEIPEPKDGEAVLEPAVSAFGSQLSEGFDGV